MKLLFVIAGLIAFTAFGQQPNYNDSTITIKGRVSDTAHAVTFYNTVVLNKSSHKGVFGDYNGNFSITVTKKDTIGISVRGYKTIFVCYKDSSFHKVYATTFYLSELSYQAEEVVIVPLKTLEELKDERAAIEKREVPQVSVTNAIQSPITALYVAFSHREKTKRLVAEMEYKDKQDDIVREILRIYVHNDILSLSSEDFNEFISFLNLDPQFLKTATDYELVTFIKAKYERFKLIKEGY